MLSPPWSGCPRWGCHGRGRTRSLHPPSQMLIPSAELDHTWPAVGWARTLCWGIRSQPGFPNETTDPLEGQVLPPESFHPSWLGPRAGMVEEPNPTLVQLSSLLTALKTFLFIDFSPPSFPLPSEVPTLPPPMAMLCSSSSCTASPPGSVSPTGFLWVPANRTGSHSAHFHTFPKLHLLEQFPT